MNSYPPFLATKIEKVGGPEFYYWQFGTGIVAYPSIAVLTEHTPQ